MKSLAKCLELLQQEGYGNVISASPIDNNLFHWKSVIKGPIDSPFQDTLFTVDVKFPEDYPFNPPKVKFDTKIFHPNIDFNTGEICLDILKNEWSPIWYPQHLILSICNLLADPYLQDPINPEAAAILMQDKKRHEAIVKIYIRPNEPVEQGLGLSRKKYVDTLLVLKDYISSSLYSKICELFNNIKTDQGS